MPPCDPSRLWIEFKIRWCDNGKKGSGWHKLKETGRSTFYVKLTVKRCPICGLRFNLGPNENETMASMITLNHQRPAEWLAIQDKTTRDDPFKADEVTAMLMADAHALLKED